MGQATKTAKIVPKSVAVSSGARRRTASPPVPKQVETVRKQLSAAWIFAGALCLAFVAYLPSLNGDFVFDDRNLPMMRPNVAVWDIGSWLHVRPLLMLTYFANYKTTGLDHAPYHVVNIFLHALCTLLIYYAVRRILALAKTNEQMQTPLALFAAGLFLLHPVQTEAVSYIASRSEDMSVFLMLSAFCVFLYRKENAVTARIALGVLALYGLAMSTKEHTAVLPAVLLLTDYFWNPGFSFSGIRRNWKLYIPIVLAGAAGLALVFRYVSAASNLGFELKDFTWQQYFFTQLRAFFIYLRLFILPYGQSADWDFPISYNILSHGAIFYGAALLLMIGAAWVFRKRFPLAAYGFFVTLILLAPTSSFMPIKDTLAERRMYLPFIGLTLIVCEALRRAKWKQRTMTVTLATICAIFGALTWVRNGSWTDMETLWRSALKQNPENSRAFMGLGTALAIRGQCSEALDYFQKSALKKVDYQILFNVGNAQECLNQHDAALASYEHALYFDPTAETHCRMGMVKMKLGHIQEALHDFDVAQQLDQNYTLTYNYRGLAFLALGQFDDAAAQFTRVLALDQNDAIAVRGMDRARNHIRQY